MKPADAALPAMGNPVGRLLRSFSWAECRHHAARNMTAVVAVMLGVALAFSVHLINESALGEFSAAVRSVNGQADLSIKAAAGLLDESLYPRLALHPQVAAASPVIEASTQALDRHGQRRPLRIVGLDPLVAAPISLDLLPRLAEKVPRLDLFAIDAISLNAVAQRVLGVGPGEELAVQTGLRVRRLRVVGTVTAGGDALGVMDIGSAQAVFAMPGRLSRIDIKLVDGASRQDALTSFKLGEGVLAESADDATQRVSNVSRAYRVNLTVLALVALFTGAFLVFSILSLSVAKRQQQFALLGVLGLTGRERLQLVLWESALLGMLGSALGLAAGTGLAASALQLLAGDLGGGYFPGIAPRLQWSAPAAWAYGVLGVAAAMLGGWLPARRAQRLSPAQALKGQGDAVPSARLAWLVGPLLIALGVGLALLPPVGGVPLFAYVSVAALLIGGIACVPVTVGGLLRLLPATHRPAVLLAVERARRMRHTATIAIAGVVASLSLSVALTVMVSSFRESVTTWLDRVLPADLYARAAGVGGQADAVYFGDSVVDAIRHLPGVRRVAGLRVVTLRLAPALPEVALIARDLVDPDHPARQSLPLVGELVAPAPGAINVYASEAMADLHDARPGTWLSLPLRPGLVVKAHVRGVWRDYARQQGAIVMEMADYRRITGDRQVNDLALWLADTALTADVQRALRRAVASQGLDGGLIEFAEPRQIRQTTLRIFDRSFAVTYWLQAVAIAIGLFGVAASFSAQVLARRKEFGLLSHLGFTRRQILGIVAGEGAALSAVGVLLGWGLGLAVSVVLVHVVNPQSFHWTMDLILPWGRLTALGTGVLAVGTLTAWIAGRAAAGQEAVMAVKEDW